MEQSKNKMHDGRTQRKPLRDIKCHRLHIELSDAERTALSEMSRREFLSLGAMVRKLIREKAGIQSGT